MNTATWVGTTLNGSFLVLVALFSFACALPTQPNRQSSAELSRAELLDFQSHYMNSYNANTFTPVVARTTISVGSHREGGTWTGAPYPTGVSFSTVTGTAGTTLANYPDQGLSTRFTVTAQSPRADIYLIEAVTSYPATDARSTYTEAYYVQDVSLGDAASTEGVWVANPDGQWTSDDPVVVKDTWVQNQSARSVLTLTYRNGTYRTEAVYSNSNAGGTKYALPDVTGSLQMKDTSLPALDPEATYTSIVGYVTKPVGLTASSYWNATTTPPIVIGFRIYSEKAGVWSSVAFERIVVEDESLANLSLEMIQNIVIYNGRAYGNRAFTALGTSVLRENASTKVMETTLFNNVKGLTYKLSLDNTGQIVLVNTTSGNLIAPF